MIKVKPTISRITTIPPSDKKILHQMYLHSKQIMAEYGDLFKSKTLETLYQPNFHYDGSIPKTTYIIDKKTGKRKLILITQSNHKYKFNKNINTETYTARTLGLTTLGKKSFETETIGKYGKIYHGYMSSKQNNRYAGTQIRLTQVEVERAINLGVDNIPLYGLPEAVPFHSMMGFRPDATYREISSVKEIETIMHQLKDSCSGINDEHFTPILHYQNDKYYIDENQTVANALLRHFKAMEERGEKRDFHKIFVSNGVSMHLNGAELEAWRQRALSQPILPETCRNIKNCNK